MLYGDKLLLNSILLVLGTVLLVLAVAAMTYYLDRELYKPLWSWLLFVAGLVLLLAGLISVAVSSRREKRGWGAAVSPGDRSFRRVEA